MSSMRTSQAFASGGMLFAAIMMVLGGLFQFFEGLAAVIKDQFYVTTPNYAFRINVTGWGWIHMLIGAIVAVTGFFLFKAATWARVTGIALVSLSALSNFLFLPYYPFWALLLIAFDVYIIWALATARSFDM